MEQHETQTTHIKRCPRCQKIKPRLEFSNAYCKTCTQEYYSSPEQKKRKHVRSVRRKKLLAENFIGARTEEKKCYRCGIVKKAAQFNFSKTTPTGLTDDCCECKRLYGRYFSNRVADRRNKRGTCTFEEWLAVVKKGACIYCGFPNGLGVDRIDNSLGHVRGNMEPCCGVCNRIRSNVFTTLEMKTIFGPAVASIRKERELLVRRRKYD